MEVKRLGFINRLVIAVAKPKEYWKTVTQGGSKVIGFLAIVLVITTFCGFPLDYINMSISTNGFKDIISEHVPEFQISNGRLEMDDVYVLDQDNVYLYIDTNYDEFSYEDVAKFVDMGYYDDVLLMGAEKGFLYNDGKYQNINLTKIDTFKLDKSSLMGLIKVVNIFAVLAIIILYICIFIWYLFMSFIYSLIGQILKKSLGIGSEVTIGQVFLMAISAKVTMRLILALCKLINVDIPYFKLISFGVTLIYLYFGLKGLKENKMQGSNGTGANYTGEIYSMPLQQPYESSNGFNYTEQNYTNSVQPGNYYYPNQNVNPSEDKNVNQNWDENQ